MIESVMRFGALRGFLLGTARLLRCNGWLFTGGGDAVPEVFSMKAVFLPYREFSRFKRRR
jgi:putative component of membrane protein insertase Oxa1/YidC/SpoIIIJ protein YidD